MANVTWSTTDKSASITLSGTNNLVATSSSGAQWVRSASGQVSGKFYFELTYTAASTAGATSDSFGLAVSSANIASGSAGQAYLTAVGSFKVNSASQVFAFAGAVAVGTVVCYAVDLDNQRVWVRLGAAGNWNNNSGNAPTTPSTGTSFAALGSPGITLFPFVYLNGSGGSITANFGDTAFSGTVPTGYTAGMPTGGTNNALFTQMGAEVWSAGSPGQAQFTQIGVEVWRSVLDSASPGKGQLIITGYPPSQINDVQTLPDAGGLILTGYAPTDAMQFKPGRGQLIVTGYPPLLVGDVQSLPGVGGLIITGKVPSHGESIRLPGGATLTIVGYEPTLLELRSGTMAQVFILT